MSAAWNRGHKNRLQDQLKWRVDPPMMLIFQNPLVVQWCGGRVDITATSAYIWFCLPPYCNPKTSIAHDEAPQLQISSQNKQRNKSNHAEHRPHSDFNMIDPRQTRTHGNFEGFHLFSPTHLLTGLGSMIERCDAASPEYSILPASSLPRTGLLRDLAFPQKPANTACPCCTWTNLPSAP